MRESKPWRNLLKKRHIDFDWGLRRFMMKSFMGVVCTVMLYIVYRTTNYQYLETELDSKLYRFYTSKETVSASSSLKGLPRGIIEAKSDLELKPLWSTSSSKSEEGKSNCLTIKRALQLVVEDTDTTNPKDISYVFSGYTPLSIRLIQHAIRSGWRPLEQILKLLPGTHTQSKRSAFANDSHTLPHVDKLQDGRRSLVLVVFVGGVTFAEISSNNED